METETERMWHSFEEFKNFNSPPNVNSQAKHKDLVGIEREKGTPASLLEVIIGADINQD